MSRVVAIGDVHGCIEELKDLLQAIDYTSKDRVVLLGDLVDRGPDPVGVVRMAQEFGWESVKGNHDEKLVRWHKRVAEEKQFGRPNKMQRPKPERLAQWEAFSEEDIRWMDALPWTIDLSEGWIGVHAGFEPAWSLRDLVGTKREDIVCRVRYVDRYGKHIASPQVGGVPENTVYWTNWNTGEWRAPKKVVYGHAVQGLAHPTQVVRDDIGGEFWGVDTGGCFGGYLTAWILTEGQVSTVGVPCRAKYADLRPEQITE